jgi:hypothetical protein
LSLVEAVRPRALNGADVNEHILATVIRPVALHVAADHGSVEHVHRGKQGRRSVAFVIMGHGSGAALLHRQAGLVAVERLDLAFLVDGKDDGVRRRIDMEPNDTAQFADEIGARESLNCRIRCGWRPCARRCAARS